MASVLKKLAGDTAVYGLSSIVGRLLNYLLVPLYTRVFAPDEYGIVTDIFAYIGFFLVILTYGIETAFFRFSEKNKTSESVYSTALVSLAVTSLLFIGLMYFLSDLTASALKYPEHGNFVLIMSIVVALDAFTSLPFAKLRLENKAMKFAKFKLLNIGTNIGLNLFFLLLLPSVLKDNSESFLSIFYVEDFGVGYIFLSNLIASLLSLVLFVPDILKTKFLISIQLLKTMLRYAMPLLFAGLAGMINEVLDRILLKYFISVPDDIANTAEETDYIFSQIGIYAANYKLAILITLFIQAFRYAAEPFFFAQKDKADAPKTYAAMMKYFMIFGIAMFLFVILYLDIFQHFIGEDYREGLGIVPILLAASLFLGAVYNLSVWYKLTDKTKVGMNVALIGAGVTIVLNIILIPILGYVGSAWATFFCYLSMMLISYYLGQKHFPIPYELKRIGLYAALALAIYLIHDFVPVKNQTLNLIRATILLGIYGFAVIYTENWASRIWAYVVKLKSKLKK